MSIIIPRGWLIVLSLALVAVLLIGLLPACLPYTTEEVLETGTVVETSVPTKETTILNPADISLDEGIRQYLHDFGGEVIRPLPRQSADLNVDTAEAAIQDILEALESQDFTPADSRQAALNIANILVIFYESPRDFKLLSDLSYDAFLLAQDRHTMDQVPEWLLVCTREILVGYFEGEFSDDCPPQTIDIIRMYTSMVLTIPRILEYPNLLTAISNNHLVSDLLEK